MTDNAPLISNFMGLLDECSERNRYDTSTFMNRIGTIVGAGAFVNDMITIYGTDAPQQVFEKMRQLVSKLGGIWSAVFNAFEELERVVLDTGYYKILRFKVRGDLLSYMKTAIFHPRADVRERFRQTCEQNSPLQLAREFMNRVKRDVDSSGKTFDAEKMKVSIDTVLASLFMLECFANGMFSKQNMHGPNSLKQEIMNFTNSRR